jgi:hypothetical protein
VAQIFVSHSKQDRELVDYLAKVAAGTKVQLIFEELEKLLSGSVTAQQIQARIAQSKAVFVVVTPNVSNLPHTRDWVTWESGCGSSKDVWVLERASLVGQTTVAIPRPRHYVVFEPTEAWFPYFRLIIESYDDSHVLPSAAAGSGVGALLAVAAEAALGPAVFVGALVGMVLSSKEKQRPVGVEMQCAACGSTYSAHLPKGWTHLRCPVCNSAMKLSLPASPH